VDEFQGHGTPYRFELLGEIDGSHSTLAENLFDLKHADPFADERIAFLAFLVDPTLPLIPGGIEIAVLVGWAHNHSSRDPGDRGVDTVELVTVRSSIVTEPRPLTGTTRVAGDPPTAPRSRL
jgi:hypothetical protein